jgi:hypothetical protein
MAKNEEGMMEAPLSHGVLRERRFVVVLSATGANLKVRYVGDLWENAFPPGIEGSDEEFIEKLIAGFKADGLPEKGRLRLYQADYTKVWDSEEEEDNAEGH